MPDIYKDNVFISQGDVVSQKVVYSSEKPQSLDIIERIGGEIRSGSLEYFFDHVLPPMKPGLDIDHIYNSCIKTKILSKKRGSKEYTWKSIRKNARATPAHKTRFVNLFRSVTRMAQRNTSVNTGMTSTHFDILDNGPEVKSGRDRNDDQDSVIYLENTLQSLPDTSEEEPSSRERRPPRTEESDDSEFVTPTNHLHSDRDPMDQVGHTSTVPRLSRAFSMPLPSQLGPFQNPRREFFRYDIA